MPLLVLTNSIASRKNTTQAARILVDSSSSCTTENRGNAQASRSFWLRLPARSGWQRQRSSRPSGTTSGLYGSSLSPARGIRLGLLEGMDRRCGHACARWDELLVLFLVSRTVRFACSICRQTEVLLLGDSHQIHALLCEEILAHRPMLPAVHAHLPRQG